MFYNIKFTGFLSIINVYKKLSTLLKFEIKLPKLKNLTNSNFDKIQRILFKKKTIWEQNNCHNTEFPYFLFYKYSTSFIKTTMFFLIPNINKNESINFQNYKIYN